MNESCTQTKVFRTRHWISLYNSMWKIKKTMRWNKKRNLEEPYSRVQRGKKLWKHFFRNILQTFDFELHYLFTHNTYVQSHKGDGELVHASRYVMKFSLKKRKNIDEIHFLKNIIQFSPWTYLKTWASVPSDYGSTLNYICSYPSS